MIRSEFFVDDKVERRLGDAKVGGGDAFVEAEKTFCLVNAFDHFANR